MSRACKFYGQVFQVELQAQSVFGMEMAFFPDERQAVSGALIKGEDYTPSDKGSLLYLNGGEDLSQAASRIESAGGKLILPKTMISEENGYFALFIDSEGNKLALHSMA